MMEPAGTCRKVLSVRPLLQQLCAAAIVAAESRVSEFHDELARHILSWLRLAAGEPRKRPTLPL